MKKFKLILVSLIMALCCMTPAFAGCSFLPEDDSNNNKLQARSLTMLENSKCIAWNISDTSNDEDYADDYAKAFEIYCNDNLIETVDNSCHIYDFSNLLNEIKTYEFFIIAKSSNKYIEDSDVSNVVSYTNNSLVNKIGSVNKVNVNNTNISVAIANRTVAVNATKAPENISNYLIYLKSNSTGLNVYSVDIPQDKSDIFTISLDENKYNILNEIYAIRIGYTLNGVNYIASDIIYYNPDICVGYTDNIFTFDGCIYDFYANTLSELKTLIYYTFIYRIENFNIKISDEIAKLAEMFDGKNFNQQLDSLLYHECFGNVFETMCYSANNRVGNSYYFSRPISAQDKTYNIKVSYNNIYECDEDYPVDTGYILPQVKSECYWEQAGYTSLLEEYGADYDNFASDKQFEYTLCKTSEELYWAVENKVTPIIKDVNSRASKIYENAKTVLREIISEDMSDYEKVLCVFDWVCTNSQYDYYSISYNSEDIMNNPCFYLESILLNLDTETEKYPHYAVCDGFSKAFSLMCNMLGIDALRIVGYAGTDGNMGGHAWNKVLLDKDPTDDIPAQYYIVDITWTELSVVENTEELAHMYFLVGDKDIESTHKEFAGRLKYADYVSADNYYHYTEQGFEYKEVDYDMVITSADEIAPLFEYMLINDLDNVEIVIDLNYMISEYQKANGYYMPYSDYFYNTTTGTLIYYYDLRNFFNQTVLKSSKFASQYIFINYSASAIKYNEAGDVGIVYTMQQNLLIDEPKEIAELVSFMYNNQVTGDYTLYIKNSIFGNYIGDYIAHAEELFANALADTNLDFAFKVIKTNDAYDGKQEAAVYKLTITKK